MLVRSVVAGFLSAALCLPAAAQTPAKTEIKIGFVPGP